MEEKHDMDAWDIPVPEIMNRMGEADDELSNSTGDFIYARDLRYVTGQFLLRTDGMFEQHHLPDLVFGNVPHPLLNAAANILNVINTYQFARRDEVEFKNGLLLMMEGKEFTFKQYNNDKGEEVPNTLEVCSTQQEVDWCACCEGQKHIGE